MGSRARRAAPAATMLAPAIGAVRGLAGPADRATALVAGMVQGALARQLQALMTSFEAGNGLHLYIASEQTNPQRLPGRLPPPAAASRGDVTAPDTARHPGKGGRTGRPRRPGQSGTLLFAPKAGSSPLTQERYRI